MPTYAYRCTACNHEFERFQKFSDDPLTECPECAGLIRRVLHPVGVVFKGSGWYITDSRKPEPSENGSTAKGEKSDKPEKADKAEKAEKVDAPEKPAPEKKASKAAAAAD